MRIEGRPDRCELPRDLLPLGGQDAIQSRCDVAADLLGRAVGGGLNESGHRRRRLGPARRSVTERAGRDRVRRVDLGGEPHTLTRTQSRKTGRSGSPRSGAGIRPGSPRSGARRSSAATDQNRAGRTRAAELAHTATALMNLCRIAEQRLAVPVGHSQLLITPCFSPAACPADYLSPDAGNGDCDRRGYACRSGAAARRPPEASPRPRQSRRDPRPGQRGHCNGQR